MVSLASDWDGRNEDGVEPLAKYIRTIDALSGLGGSAFADIILGNGAAAAGVLLLAAVIYIGGALLVTILYFRNKELDF